MPDVKSTHSVSQAVARATGAGSMAVPHRTAFSPCGSRNAISSKSVTIACVPAACMAAGIASTARSGGQRTSLAATPSNSISASAAAACPVAATNTACPCKALGPPSMAVPFSSADRNIGPRAVSNAWPSRPAAFIRVQREGQSLCAIIIGCDEVAERHGKSAFQFGKGIETGGLLHARDHNRPA